MRYYIQIHEYLLFKAVAIFLTFLIYKITVT